VIHEYQGGRHLKDIAQEYGVSYQALRIKLKRVGLIPQASPRLRGPAHGSWQGGKTVVSGYIYVIPVGDDLDYCVPNSLGYVAEHRLIMGRMIGRPVRKDETVHHINGDRRDNSPENLQLRQGNHGKGARLVCGDCGSHNLVHAEL
jgi:hypothetical protein